MIVLDTCALIFDALSPDRLSSRALAAIDRAGAAGELAISDVSLWEVAMLVSRGRLHPGTDAATFLGLVLAARSIAVLPISAAIACRAASLGLHGDPADRIIVATALENRASLITTDARIIAAGAVRTLK
jgi:PIN domain nuclease of toxin-antitoxin system